jgi:hypothetical protein
MLVAALICAERKGGGNVLLQMRIEPSGQVNVLLKLRRSRPS